MRYISVPLLALLAFVLAIRHFDLHALLVSLRASLCCVSSFASTKAIEVPAMLLVVCFGLVWFYLLVAHA